MSKNKTQNYEGKNTKIRTALKLHDLMPRRPSIKQEPAELPGKCSISLSLIWVKFSI